MQQHSSIHKVVESVTLRVRDLVSAQGFYQDVLGLERREGTQGAVSFAAPDGEAPLVHLVEAPDADPKPPRALGLYHFALLVPSRGALGAVLRRLSESGIRLQGASDHDVSEALYLADPDGHGIEIYRDRPPEEWTYTKQGELYMTTRPLDLQDVSSSAEETGGLPRGTIIGHIHLHVSDLKKAEAFYVDDLGFDVTVRSYPGALFLSTGGYHHHVGLNTWAGRQAAPPNDHTIGMAAFSLDPPKNPRPSGELISDPDGILIHIQ